MKKDFYDKIKEFNKIYKLPISSKPTLPTIERLRNFKNILQEEVNEIDTIIEEYAKNENSINEDKKIKILTDLSDWFGDLVVYITSESVKCGLDLDKTLEIIMDSNFSKLDLNGKPIYDERGKVLKGPNYWKPEPKIEEHLRKKDKT